VPNGETCREKKKKPDWGHLDYERLIYNGTSVGPGLCGWSPLLTLKVPGGGPVPVRKGNWGGGWRDSNQDRRGRLKNNLYPVRIITWKNLYKVS